VLVDAVFFCTCSGKPKSGRSAWALSQDAQAVFTAMPPNDDLGQQALCQPAGAE
jgi:hypothetical protein